MTLVLKVARLLQRLQIRKNPKLTKRHQTTKHTNTTPSTHTLTMNDVRFFHRCCSRLRPNPGCILGGYDDNSSGGSSGGRRRDRRKQRRKGTAVTAAGSIRLYADLKGDHKSNNKLKLYLSGVDGNAPVSDSHDADRLAEKQADLLFSSQGKPNNDSKHPKIFVLFSFL